MNITKTIMIMIGLLFISPVWAENPSTDTMQALRGKIEADKKLVVSVNMELTESEAKGFWPVYEGYQKDLKKINQRIGTLIESYAGDYQADSFSNDKAQKLTEEFLSIQEDEAKLMKTYSPKLSKVLPAMKVARYLQIENKIRAIVKYELAAAVPLIQ